VAWPEEDQKDTLGGDGHVEGIFKVNKGKCSTGGNTL
jgi:hypothetical protein